FSSIIGNYYYGESNKECINAHKSWLTKYRLLELGMVRFVAMTTDEAISTLADLFMNIMTILNLSAIAALGNIAFKVLQDFVKQRKKGLNPVFKASSIKELKNAECWKDE